jgi:hypothetical protein
MLYQFPRLTKSKVWHNKGPCAHIGCRFSVTSHSSARIACGATCIDKAVGLRCDTTGGCGGNWFRLDRYSRAETLLRAMLRKGDKLSTLNVRA